MHSKFGWSYPPGCSGPPNGCEGLCDVCGCSIDDCLCPECPECGEYGNPHCYQNHGLVRTPEQIASKAKSDEMIRQANKEDADAWDEFYREVQQERSTPNGGSEARRSESVN